MKTLQVSMENRVGCTLRGIVTLPETNEPVPFVLNLHLSLIHIYAQTAGDSHDFNIPEVILEQIGVQTVDDGSADHTHKAEKHYAQQRLIFGDFLDDVQVIELLTFRAFRYGYAFFAPHTGCLLYTSRCV